MNEQLQLRCVYCVCVCVCVCRGGEVVYSCPALMSANPNIEPDVRSQGLLGPDPQHTYTHIYTHIYTHTHTHTHTQVGKLLEGRRDGRNRVCRACWQSRGNHPVRTGEEKDRGT